MGKLAFALCVLVLASSACAYPKIINPASLVGWWPMEEGSGTTTQDRSGNGGPGTLNASPAWDVGRFGRGLTFNGSSSYLNSARSPVTGSGSWSISAWIKTSSLGARRDICDFGAGVSPTNAGVFFFLSTSNRVSLDLTNVGGPTSTATVTDGRWHHVAAVNSSGSVRLYVDGSQSGSAVTMSPNFQATNGLTIGRHLTNNQYFFSGSIDEVRIDARAKPANELAAEFLSGCTFHSQ